MTTLVCPNSGRLALAIGPIEMRISRDRTVFILPPYDRYSTYYDRWLKTMFGGSP